MKLIQRWDGVESTLKGWLQRFVDTIADVENWIEITPQSSSGRVDFQNLWVNYNSGTHQTAAFYKDPFGVVRIKGSIKTGTSGTVVFTLPSAYRPLLQMNYPIVESGGLTAAFLSINTSGNVNVTGANVSTYASIECSFRAA